MSELSMPLSLDKIFNFIIVDSNQNRNNPAYKLVKDVFPNAHILFITDKDNFAKEFESSKPDLIIYDVETEELNTDELLPYLTKQPLPIPLIIFTSYKNEDAVIKLINTGAADYIFKEYPKRLRHAILKCLTDRENLIELYYAQTDLRQYEQQLEKFKDYEDNFPGMTFQFTLHPNGNNSYSYISSSSKRIFNLEQEDIVRDSQLLYEFFEPEDVNKLYESFRLSAITLNPFQQEVRYNKDGKTFWYQYNAKPKRQPDGDIIWNGVLLDTTDLKSLKEELELEKKLTDELLDSINTEESKRNIFPNTEINGKDTIKNSISALTNAVFDQFLFKFFIDHSTDVIYFKNAESRFIKVNKSFTTRINASSENGILGKTDFDIYDYNHAEDARNDEIKIMQTGIPIINKIEKEILQSGKTTWVSTTKIPLTNSEGEIIGTFGMSRDITEQKIVEEALALEQSLMRELIDSIPDKIFVRDLEGKYLLSNKAHLNSLGIKNREEIIGKTDFDFYDHKVAERNREDDLHVFRTGKPSYSSEEEPNRASGKICWYMRTKVPLRNDKKEIFGLVAISHDITEIKTVQEKLQASEARLHHLITTTSGVLYTMRIINNNFVPTWIGENIKQFGYKPEEIKTNGFWDKIIHPDDYEYYISSKNSLLNDKRIVLEYRILKKNGDYIWLRDETVVIFNYFGKASEIFGSWLDITERMQSEEALLAVEAQLYKALKIAKLAYWEYDLLNNNFTLNDQYYSIMNTTTEKEGGYTISTKQLLEHFVHPDDRHILTDEIKKATETNEPRYSNTLEYRFPYADGGFGFLIIRYDFIKETSKAFGAIQDITERKKADEALSASEYFLRKSQIAARIGSYKFDIPNGLWESSETLYDICGIDENFPKDVEAYTDLIHPAHRSDVRDEIVKDIRTHQNRFEKEFKIARFNDSKERWILMVGDIEFDKDFKPLALIGTIQDITDRVLRNQEKHELENQLRQRNKELEKTLVDMKLMQGSLVQSEKMASLGQLSAGIAHEINNPLAFVSSNFNRLKEYFQDTVELLRKWQSIKIIENNNGELKQKLSEIDEFTELIDLNFILEDFDKMTLSIQDGTQRIRKIVEGMRAFSHTSESSFSDADINVAIENTITIVWNEIKYKATLNKDYGNLPKVKCNIGEIKQVIVNLLVNSAHAIEEKGIINISTRHEGEFVYIKIEDNGCGIPDSIIKKIFDPFFTTKPVGKGTGLGLWVSSSIIEKHKGSLTAQSEVGVGTTFTIKLPIAQNNPKAIIKGTVN
jgi:two-component system, NtrC family, sensor kinase